MKESELGATVVASDCVRIDQHAALWDCCQQCDDSSFQGAGTLAVFKGLVGAWEVLSCLITHQAQPLTASSCSTY
jgi:hypothetical protein